MCSVWVDVGAEAGGELSCAVRCSTGGSTDRVESAHATVSRTRAANTAVASRGLALSFRLRMSSFSRSGIGDKLRDSAHPEIRVVSAIPQISDEAPQTAGFLAPTPCRRYVRVVIDESATQRPVQSRPHRLATFGTLALVAPGEDTLLGKHGHHRRRLALLAVLAAAGDRGQSRDQLLLLFWPEATQARARHSLDQLLYALRSSIGESVFAGVNPVRLNPDVVRSDVGAFLTAIDRGDLEAAVAEYKGPFLDGFYLSDAPEFERWVETERARLATTYSGLLERLARNAEAAHDNDSAVRWWRVLNEADPLSSKNALGLMRALMNAGDRAAALQHAERHEKLVAQELGMSADPTVAELAAEIRAR